MQYTSQDQNFWENKLTSKGRDGPSSGISLVIIRKKLRINQKLSKIIFKVVNFVGLSINFQSNQLKKLRTSNIEQLTHMGHHTKFQVYISIYLIIYIQSLPSSGQTLALTEPEARLYNHLLTPTRPDPAGANVCIGYISAISQRNELKFCIIGI